MNGSGSRGLQQGAPAAEHQLSGQVSRDEPRHGGVVCLAHEVNNWIEMNERFAAESGELFNCMFTMDPRHWVLCLNWASNPQIKSFVPPVEVR
jgi:hypothetical protein